MDATESVAPEIRVRDLHVILEKREILKGISVEIPKNRITAIIGPSGCGKSTLLRCINRMIDLVEGASVTGEVLIGNVDALSPGIELTELRRRVGMISQTPNPLPMSIFDNIAFGPRIHGERDSKTLDATVSRCLKTVGLWNEVHERLYDPAAKLSIGQQQRLCLARALAMEPEVLLCDEITSALDPISAKHIESELLAIKNEYTIIFVTHILRQARRIADHVIFLYLGELVESGPAAEIFSSPKDPRTKEYLEGVFG
ncbi:MAG: phosphate ABC transporter ATP-binding protein [Methanomicrobiales archaeon]|nr:phosphate ABC transporter ATP-binding protein [Methanomicrobiales archaeon]